MSWVERCSWIAASIINDHLSLIKPRQDPKGQEISHIRWMADQLHQKAVHPDTKACRWLGYIQSYLVFTGFSSLEEEKLRNAVQKPGGMLTQTIVDILTITNKHMTAKQIAEVIGNGVSSGSVAVGCTRLFCYNRINRVRRRNKPFLYAMKS